MVKRSRIKRLPAGWEETPVTDYAILPGGMMHIGAATMDEMVEHASGRGTPSEYVRSGIWTPSYSAMTQEALNYYLHWRDNVRKRRFLKSDMGYIRLFVSELISFNKDPKNDIVLMSRLVSEYKDINILQIGTIGDA
ncbi:MAG: TerB N-terminal domain-containing protein, partial [Candidatus Methanomethylophilaceae archaeon]|nr:TerB N-terminal domain-containing protein [Candidatus Methanomethylophilaceae archaeon]